MKKVCAVALVCTFLVSTIGCNVAPPSFLRPGTAAQQQHRAEDFDPYPENDVAPPVVGSRPLGFKKPRTEVERSQWWHLW